MFRLGSMLKSILRREKLYVFEASVAESPVKAKVKVNVDVDLVRTDEILEIVEKLGGFQKDADKRLEMGHLCFVAKLNGEPVHIT
ncbi:MAG: hypothetical protein QXH91_09220, partial [Candidatus Bathyarchaeia archaeon]